MEKLYYADYPKCLVVNECVVFCFIDKKLNVLFVKRK